MSIVIIGGGVSGLVAAANIKHKNPNLNVVLIEKNENLGGRLYQDKINNYLINNGPSWYWFNDIINNVFSEIGINNFKTKSLEPQYKLILKDQTIDVPGNFNELSNLLESYDTNNIDKINRFINKNNKKYNLCKNKYLKFKNLSILEYLSFDSLKHIFSLDIFKSYRTTINELSDNNIVRTLLEWPSLFIGSNPNNISALFTILTYFMVTNGTSIPIDNGMIDIVNTLETKLKTLGVKILKNHSLKNLNFTNNKISSIDIDIDNITKTINIDKIICSCDYNFKESLLPNKYRSYPKLYWDNQIMCPSSLVFNLVLDIKLQNLTFHNLFFDYSLDEHLNYIYKYKTIPKNPLFYVNITSKLFNEVDNNKENIFILIPTGPNLEISNKEIKYLHDNIIKRLSNYLNLDLNNHIVYDNCFKDTDFNLKFNSYKNNAYGLACDFTQIGFFRPKIKSRYVNNLYFCGQLSSPGPGIPPSILSGLNSSNLLLEELKQEKLKDKQSNTLSQIILNTINSSWYYSWLLLTNTIVFLTNTNIYTSWICFKKEINYIFFNKVKEYEEFNL